MASDNTVIVFGPTGQIGSVVAQAARGHGARVFLAMRDVTKSIPNLSQEEESARGFERIQADLTDPDSLSTAVQITKARSAFIYSAHSAPNGMQDSLEALKFAGIRFVVFLSSYTIPGDPKAIVPAELVAFLHARVEINLEVIFGQSGYLAVRPGSLASNILRFKDGIKKGFVRTFCPDVKFDYVDPLDIGSVAGFYLANGKLEGTPSYVFVHGPETISQEDAIIAAGKQIGVEVTVESGTEEEELETLSKRGGMPEPVAVYVCEKLREAHGTKAGLLDPVQQHKGVEETVSCTRRAAGNFVRWLERNKGLFE